MSKKAWIIFAVVCLAVIGGFIYSSSKGKIDVSDVDVTKIQEASSINGNIAEHTSGKVDSKVILVEYGDYQCPGCGSAFPIIKKVVTKYQDKIGYIFRNYPLYSSHPNAFAAAAAAEAAGLQGKYWEMHDALYADQSGWENLTGKERTDYFARQADAIGIDSKKLVAELNSADIKKKIDYDVALGKKVGLAGTPAFYINGEDVGTLYYKDDQIVSQDTDGAALVWSNADAFEKFVIKPALEKAGIK